MKTDECIDLILSIVTIIIAILAVCLTLKQIKLSNKQQLLDRRITKYTLFLDLFGLYGNIRDMINYVNFDVAEMPDFIFSQLTECEILGDTFDLMNNLSDQRNVNLFFNKCEMLKHAAEEITVIWKMKDLSLISDFVKKYSDLLRALHRQQVYVVILSHRNKQQTGDVIEKQKAMAEKNKLYECLKEIDETYEKILNSDIREKLKDSLKLVR